MLNVRSCAKHLLVEYHHGSEPSIPWRDYTRAACRLISHGYAQTSGFTYDDAIMSPLQGSEKSSAVRIIISHTYYILSSRTTNS